MKYTLRSLMLIIMLVSVILGSVVGRIEYLRRWAVFHENEAVRYAKTKHRSLVAARPDATAAMQHGLLARRFYDAVYQPWTIVDTTPPEISPLDRDILAEDIVNGDVDGYLQKED